VTKVGREAARLAKEESRLIPEPNDVSVETRKGLQRYGCMAIVICMYFGYTRFSAQVHSAPWPTHPPYRGYSFSF